MKLMGNRDDVPSEFKYPQQGLAEVRGILTAEQINELNRKDFEEDLVRRVIKRGVATKTTVGTMTRFKAHVRRYPSLGDPRDSVEVTILPHHGTSGPFSRGGDSGSLIIDSQFRFVALLTSGTRSGPSDTADITYGTPMEWVWDQVKEKFPGADLYFGDTKDFFNDTE